MKRLALVLILVLTTSCATAGKQRAEAAATLRTVCTTYQENRALVLEFRAVAIANREMLERTSPKLWENLLIVDSKLPLLDGLGQKSCDLAAAAEAIGRADASTLKGALDVVVQAANVLKQLGLI